MNGFLFILRNTKNFYKITDILASQYVLYHAGIGRLISLLFWQRKPIVNAGDKMECKQVLILEDEPNTRKLLVKAITNEKQTELSAAVGTLAEAVKHVDLHGYPDLLLVDIA